MYIYGLSIIFCVTRWSVVDEKTGIILPEGEVELQLPESMTVLGYGDMD